MVIDTSERDCHAERMNKIVFKIGKLYVTKSQFA